MATRRKKIEIIAERANICKTCDAAHFDDNEFTCRRRPPTPVYNGMSGFIEHVHPVVAPDHWCLDFVPKLHS
jgi:hypothetical protein